MCNRGPRAPTPQKAAGEGQASAVALMNGWGVFMTNAGPSPAPMTMHAVRLDDSSKSFSIKSVGAS